MPEPRVRAVPAPGDPRWDLPGPLWMRSEMAHIGDGDGRCPLLLSRESVTRLEVSSAGFEPKFVDVDPTHSPASGEVEVELSGGEAPATLVVSFTGAPEVGLDGAYLFLIRFDFDQGFDRVGPAVVRDGLARFEQVPAGCDRVTLSWHLPESMPFDELPFVLGENVQLELGSLQAGEVRAVDVPMTAGGRIELHTIGRDPGRAAPVFALEDASGATLHPTPIARTPSGHETLDGLDRDGPVLLGRALAPGRYRLLQIGADYAEGARDVDVRAGSVTAVSFQLEPK